MSEKNPIDEHFKTHLANAKVEPSADLWSKMEPRLDDHKAGRRGWFIGVAASITLVFAVSSWLYDNYQNDGGLPDNGITIEKPEDNPNTTPDAVIDTPQFEDLQEETPGVNSIADDADKVQPSSSPRRETSRPTERIAQGRQNESQEENRTLAMNTETSSGDVVENLDRQAQDASPKIGVEVKIDPYRYLKKAEPAQEDLAQADTETEKVALGDYAEQQFDNLIQGKSLEAPSKENIRWPEVSINLSPIIQKFTPDTDNSTTEQ
ncbi:hypothetical protein [Phaeocystidibacter luteus]|uniref:Uncharacterized protein n=1 Tax=Phaeocystidibacter luteus TaxID=911197 RepID=A0A6N6RHQ1_9FLAO|nr:hypothetical protein [Phaeocystidibacter luteus]KAB2813875.1 hypothetical protein F8C67_04105 [Phaeocystidibacter luteus]